MRWIPNIGSFCQGGSQAISPVKVPFMAHCKSPRCEFASKHGELGVKQGLKAP